MRGSYGSVLVLFGLFVALARALGLGGFGDLPLEWMLAIHLLLVFGLAWVAAAVIVRAVVRIRAMARLR